MAFKGLSERFEKRAHDLYAHGSNHDSGLTRPNDQPYVERKPDDPKARETANDSRLVPIGSIKRDVTRLTNFSKSDRGLLFMGKEAFLQAANTFSETRLYNPLFVIASAQPYIHIRRALAVPSSFAVTGDTSQMSPGSDSKTQAAGRLQKSSSKDAVARVMGSRGASGLLGLLNPGTLVSAIVGTLGFNGVGSLGANQRPELDVENQYYSVLMWKGYKKQLGVKGNLNSTAANLRIGNIKGAVNSLKSGISDLLHGVRSGVGAQLNLPNGRGQTDEGLDGRRYFLTDAKNADRYLTNSISFTVNAENRTVPVPHTVFLDRRPYILNSSVVSPVGPAAPLSSTQAHRGLFDSITKAASAITSNLGVFGTSIPVISPSDIAMDASSTDDNPAESAMLFPNLSLQRRYETDARADFIRGQIQVQKTKMHNYWKTHQTNTGFVGGLKAGDQQDINPRARQNIASYAHDKLNDFDIIADSGDLVVSPQTRNRIKSEAGEDLVTILFYDFVKKNTIPFRAFIGNIAETITPEVSDTRYVGRIERNIIYVGVSREVSFTLRVHAFNRAELDKIWKKINYMTGLCFPATYSNGFMVPPLVKLTIGDMYRDQPGYIRSLTHVVEDGVSWEVDGQQVPHGITMNVGFAIIEKAQMQSTSNFYPYYGDAGRAAAESAVTSISQASILSPLSFFG